MRQLKNLFVALALCAPLTAAAQSIEINAENFPDENFRSYLLEQDYGLDGVIAEAELNEIIWIEVTSRNISSLEGIEHFTALEYLICDDNQLTTLDVSNNTALAFIVCSANQLTALDLSNSPALIGLECVNNQITTLNVSGCTALESLQCSGNGQLALNASGCTALTEFWAGGCNLTLLNLSGCTALTELEFSSTFQQQITSLDVSGCTVLTRLNCSGIQLVSLNLSGCTALTYLYCNGNQLTSLDVSGSTTGSTSLAALQCYSNQLKTLDVSNNTALTHLDCYDNQLTALDVSNNTALTSLYCGRNQIKGESMDALVNSLPETTAGSLTVYYEGIANEGNVITKSQVATAKAKGWTSFYWPSNGDGWREYEGMDDSATSITLPEIENGSAAIYTLSGQNVTDTTKKGVYIINGKKVVVK